VYLKAFAHADDTCKQQQHGLEGSSRWDHGLRCKDDGCCLASFMAL
jgi:hypothetical protein